MSWVFCSFFDRYRMVRASLSRNHLLLRFNIILFLYLLMLRRVSTCFNFYSPPPLLPSLSFSRENRYSIIEIVTPYVYRYVSIFLVIGSSILFHLCFEMCDSFVAQYVRIFFHITMYYCYSYIIIQPNRFVTIINSFFEGKIIYFSLLIYSLVITSASSYYDSLR